MRPRQVDGDLALTVFGQSVEKAISFWRFEDGKPLTKCTMIFLVTPSACRNGPSRLDAADGVVQPGTTAE